MLGRLLTTELVLQPSIFFKLSKFYKWLFRTSYDENSSLCSFHSKQKHISKCMEGWLYRKDFQGMVRIHIYFCDHLRIVYCSLGVSKVSLGLISLCHHADFFQGFFLSQ